MMSKQQLQGFNKGVEVVGCFLQCKGEFVLLHRQRSDVHGDMFGLPAGKVDAGETIYQAMVRELQEETGVILAESELSYSGPFFVRHDGRDFVWHMFGARLFDKPAITLSPSEHQGFIWTTPENALKMPNLIFDLDFCIKNFYQM